MALISGNVILLICLCALSSVMCQDRDADPYDTNDVRIPPSIIESGPAQVTYKTDEDIEIPCVATGTPTPEYTWYHNGKEVELTHKDHITLAAAAESGTLIFKPLTSLDEGGWQCYAQNQHGTTMTGITFLKRAVLSPSSDSTVKIKNVIVGAPLTLPCMTLKSVPEAVISWQIAKNDKEDKEPVAVNTNDRITIGQDGSLNFAILRDNDVIRARYQRMIYKCNAFNNVMDVTSGGSYFELNKEGEVKSIPNENQIATVKPYPALVGHDVEFKCFFSSSNESKIPEIGWKRTHEKMLPSRASILEGKTILKITNVQEDDEGDYVCYQSTSKKPAEGYMSLVVHKEPIFLAGGKPSDKNITQGESVTFSCTADGKPTPTVQWFKNGRPLDASRPGHKISINGNELTVDDVQKSYIYRGKEQSDLMVIQCNASNIHNYTFSSAYINVLLPTILITEPVDFELDPLTPEEDRPSEVLFDCEAQTDASTPLTVEWFRGEDLLDIESEPRLSVYPNNTLRIDILDMKEKDEDKLIGHYTCKITNGYSTITTTATFSVKGKETPGPVTGAAFELWWLLLVIAIILLLLILLLCCCLCMQRNKGDTYPVDEKERANGNDPEKELQDSGFHDYQRPEDNEPVKGSRASLTSTIKMDSDDEGSLAEYGDIDPGKFTEDGSFIGQYATDKKRRPPPSDSVV